MWHRCKLAVHCAPNSSAEQGPGAEREPYLTATSKHLLIPWALFIRVLLSSRQCPSTRLMSFVLKEGPI